MTNPLPSQADYDAAAVAAIGDQQVGWQFKGMPPDAESLTLAELAGQHRDLFPGGFTGPILTIDRSALEHNLTAMKPGAQRAPWRLPPTVRPPWRHNCSQAALSAALGGGSAGDGTALLAELIARRASGVVAIIADPEVVAASIDAGVGGRIDVPLGGRSDNLHGDPIHIVATVERLTDGHYVTDGTWMTGQHFRMGSCAVLRVEPASALVLVTSRPTPPFHREQLTHAGIDPAGAGVIVAKGAVAWRSAYGGDAKTVIEVDTPGACPLDINALVRTTRPGRVGSAR